MKLPQNTTGYANAALFSSNLYQLARRDELSWAELSRAKSIWTELWAEL